LLECPVIQSGYQGREGVMATKEYGNKGFRRLRINGPFEIDIKRGDYQVSLDAGLFKRVLVEQEGETLNIRLDWFYSVLGFLTGFRRSTLHITLPELTELRVSGASRGDVGDFTASDFLLEVSGASQIRLEKLETAKFELKAVGSSVLDFKELSGTSAQFNITGASRITGSLKFGGDVRFHLVGASQVDMFGRAGNAEIDAAGASRVTLDGLDLKNARVKLVGASRAVVKLDGRLDASLAGASNLSWYGNPTMGEISAVGASTIKKA
jgi:hypothetical protein